MRSIIEFVGLNVVKQIKILSEAFFVFTLELVDNVK